MAGKIKVLITDDSIFFRTALTNMLKSDPRIEVVGTAVDAMDAERKIKALKPDVMTLDINMPKINGIQFLKEQLPKKWIPTIVISTKNDIVFEAMNAGAVDFVEKPSMTPLKSTDEFSKEIANKVIAASKAKPKVKPAPASPILKPPMGVIKPGSLILKNGLIALGASTGGTEATSAILKQLPAEIPGMVIVQHMPPVFTDMYAKRLTRETKLNVKEAAEGDIVKPGHAYIAPGDKHMTVEKKGNNFIIHTFTGEKVSGHRPSVDVMFDSVAKFSNRNVVGIILTGMGEDGARGLTKMRRKGAYTIGQDKESSIVYGMPMVAYQMGGVAKQASLDDVAPTLMGYLAKC